MTIAEKLLEDPVLGVGGPKSPRAPLSLAKSIPWTKHHSPPAIAISSPEDFLEAHSSLQPLVEEAKDRLLSAFGDSTKVTLKLFRDPDDPAPAPELFVVANVLMEPADAIAAMEKVELDWWFDQLDRSDGLVHITFKHRAE